MRTRTRKSASRFCQAAWACANAAHDAAIQILLQNPNSDTTRLSDRFQRTREAEEFRQCPADAHEAALRVFEIDAIRDVLEKEMEEVLLAGARVSQLGEESGRQIVVAWDGGDMTWRGNGDNYSSDAGVRITSLRLLFGPATTASSLRSAFQTPWNLPH